MIRPRTILQLVAQYRGIAMPQLSGATRIRHVVWARQECCWLMRRHTRLSFAQIGFELGGRDHSTAQVSVQAVARRAAGDPQYQAEIDGLEALVLSSDLSTASDASSPGPVINLARQIVAANDSATQADAHQLAIAVLTLSSVLGTAGLGNREARAAANGILSGGEAVRHG